MIYSVWEAEHSGTYLNPWRYSRDEKFGISKLHLKVAVGLGIVHMVLVCKHVERKSKVVTEIYTMLPENP